MTARLGLASRLLAGLALLHAALAAPAGAQATAGVVADFVTVQNAMIQASLETQRGQADQALATIDQALATLAGIETALADPAVAEALGKRLRAVGRRIRSTEKKVGKARTAIVKGKRARVQLRKLRVAAKSSLKSALGVGRPVVAEIDPRSAGFHHPGDEVQLQIFAADGSSCGVPPVVEVQNDSFGSSVDLGSVVVDEATGVISIRLGEDQGGVRVSVSVCGNPPTTVLLYNYGPKPPKGLPKGFPVNLPPGDYQMTFGGTIAGVTIPTTTVGVFTLDDLKSFADQIVGAFREAARAASAVPGCGLRVGYSGFDGAGFSISIRIRCSVNGVSASGDLTFRVDRVGAV